MLNLGNNKGKTERKFIGCTRRGSNFHILPIATPKFLIVWPQRKYCRDHSIAASWCLAADNLSV